MTYTPVRAQAENGKDARDHEERLESQDVEGEVDEACVSGLHSDDPCRVTVSL